MTGVVQRALERALARAVRRVREAGRSEEGSLPLVMLIFLIGLALGAVLIPMVLTQDRSTVFVASRENSLAAAQGGIDVIVGRIRASSAAGAGDPSRIPCSPAAAPTTGVVGTPNTSRYSVSVVYYTVDPVLNPSATPMLCVPNRGTFDVATGRTVPSYATITSTGADGTAGSGSGRSNGRTLRSTYVFKTTNRNIAGGQIRIYPPAGASSPTCMDASGSPVVGTVVVLQPCSVSLPPAPQQVFTYRTDLTLQLASSSTLTNGLCTDTATTSGNPVQGGTVVLAACSALGSPTFSQQWSFNDNGGFTAATSTTATTSKGSFATPTNPAGLCMAVTDQTAGRQLTLADCGLGGTSSPTQAWVPSPAVGDGAAAVPQLVNYEQFGRCLDVTGTNVGATHMIAYPCKQNPYPAAVSWNQKWFYDATSKQLYTLQNNSTRYCLTSPRAEDRFVTLTPCSTASTTPGLQWKSLGGASTTAYSQRYTFVDSSTDATRCLSIHDPPAVGSADNPGDTSPWSWATVATCNGSTAQKWNADPNLGLPSLQNTNETQ